MADPTSRPEPPPPDADRRSRRTRAIVIAMLLSLLCGILDVFSKWPMDRMEQLKSAASYTALAFWTLYPILYFAYVRKSAATLEYQEQVRMGNQPKQPPD
jgi:hypothetical protein